MNAIEEILLIGSSMLIESRDGNLNVGVYIVAAVRVDAGVMQVMSPGVKITNEHPVRAPKLDRVVASPSVDSQSLHRQIFRPFREHS
jgi:hypothetical protein